MAKILKHKSEEFQRKELESEIRVCGDVNMDEMLVTMIVLCEMKNGLIYDSNCERY
jgi:hypothetical protein